MTELLYYQDPGLLEFRARVISAEDDGKNIRIMLDRTAFYPEGGGQPADRGTIAGLEIKDVKKESEDVVHIAAHEPGGECPREGETVDCVIDGGHRLDYQQQHSGQHIISASMMRIFGIETVSVHQGEEYTAVEVSAEELSEEMLDQIEAEANRCIRSDTPINAIWTDSEGLGSFNLRRPSKHDHNIRIIDIPGIDCVACGGLHLGSTLEIGLIKYTHQEKIRGHVRTFWKIGNRAYRDYSEKTRIINSLNEFYSARQYELLDKVNAAAGDCNSLKYRFGKLEEELATLTAGNLIAEAGQTSAGKTPVIIRIFDEREKGFINRLVKTLAAEDGPLISFIFNRVGDALTWAVTGNEVSGFDFKRFQAEMLPLIGGKGGGKPPLWQGAAKTPEGLPSLIEALKKYGN